MNALTSPFIYALLGVVAGAIVSWILVRSQRREALAAAAQDALRASTAFQVELSAARERASRVPELERELGLATQSLNAANERKAALESAALRLPELEARHEQAITALAQAASAAVDLRESNSRITAELSAERDNLAALRTRFEETQSRLEVQRTTANSLAVEVAQLQNTLENERSVSQEKLTLLLEAKTALTDQFKALANEILEEKSKRFAEQNQTNLGALLDPLKLKITEFQSKIEDTYVKEGKDRTALGEQVRQLMELNQHLSEDAKNLTRALRGSAKAQGTWGEWILETVLDVPLLTS
jgi:DNA recombination protein RmuC